MYHIDSKKDKPDINYLVNRLKGSLEKGIPLYDIRKYHETLKREKEEAADTIYNKYGIQNPNSYKQVSEYLEGIDDFSVYEACHDKDGKCVTDQNVLYNLVLMGFEFAEDMLEYRAIKKTEESIKSLVGGLHKDGLLHPEIALSKTNRINYLNPALMNIEKDLLWSVIAPRDESKVLYSVDIKNQEPSILINMLNIEQFKDALKSEKGLYESLFSKVFEVKVVMYLWVGNRPEQEIIENAKLAVADNIPNYLYESVIPMVEETYYKDNQISDIQPINMKVCMNDNVDKIVDGLPKVVNGSLENGLSVFIPVEWEKIPSNKLKKKGIVKVEGTLPNIEIRCDKVSRKEFKTAWNAMTYGASVLGVKHICKHIDGKHLYGYFSKIKPLEQYRLKCHRMGKNNIQETETYFGTKLVANESGSKLKRSLMDLPIQGTGTDILALLIKHLDNEIEDRRLQGKVDIYFTRHDEIILEIDKKYAEEQGKERIECLLRELLEHKVDDWVPFKVEVSEIEHRMIE